jgi:membrane protein required for colicin V production
VNCDDGGTVDLIMAGVVILSIIVGLIRGFVYEVLSLLGWLVAYAAAQALSPWTARQIPIGAADSTLRTALAVALTFVAALIVWGLLARVVRSVVRATPLTLVDRFLGAGFGTLRALVMLLAATLLVLLTPLSGHASWRCAQGAGWLTAMVQTLKPLLPDSVAHHLPI